MRRFPKRVVLTVILASLAWFGICTLFVNFSKTPVKYNDSAKPQVRAENLNHRLRKISLINSEVFDENPWVYNPYELKEWTSAPKLVWNYQHPGQDGSAATLPKDKMDLAEKTYKINNFNLVISDLIPLNRSLEDHRDPVCKTKNFPKLLPTTSVIIVFNNEAWSTLLRNVWSVINRSPKELLEEIILVDDASDQDHLKTQLDDYAATLPVPVHVFHAKNRSGIVGARLIGAKHAKGQVLTFLDAHCECSEGWLEPLLSRITENRKVVVSPVIDSISPENFKYKPKVLLKGGFDFKFQFQWMSFNDEETKKYSKDKTRPLPTPTIAGGLFSVDRQFFYEIGAYDEGMEIWGSENIEMSIRVWQCGGSMEISYCSRVGHIFRQSAIKVIGNKNTVIYHNFKRLAEVWLDEWKHYIYALYPSVREVFLGDVSARKKLRKNLQCKSFRWYLENIYPESPLLVKPVYIGSIINVESNLCLFASPMKEMNGNLDITTCTEATFQRFVFTPRGEIQTSKYCLDGPRKDDVVILYDCHGNGGNQKWFYNNIDNSLKNSNKDQCIQIHNKNETVFLPVLRDCNSSNPQQKWIMKNNYEWKVYFNKK